MKRKLYNYMGDFETEKYITVWELFLSFHIIFH